MSPKWDTAKKNKDGSCLLQEQMKNMIKLATETLKAAVEGTNKEFRKTNVILSRFWLTGKEALNKATINKESTKEIKN